AIDRLGNLAWITQDTDHTIKDRFATEQFDFHPKEVDGDVGFEVGRETHKILLGGQNHAHIAFFAACDEVTHVLGGETMVVGKAFDDIHFGTEFAQPILETFRYRNAAD